MNLANQNKTQNILGSTLHMSHASHCAFKKLQILEYISITRNTCTQQPLARLPNLFSVMLRFHTAINRADFVSW